MNTKTPPTRYIVQRPYVASEYDGGGVRFQYIATEKPIPGEQIFEGQFQAVQDCFCDPSDVFVPAEGAEITSKTYQPYQPYKPPVETFQYPD